MIKFRSIRYVGGLVLIGWWAGMTVAEAAEAGTGLKKIVFLAGTKSHGPGDHEYERGAKLLKHCLDTSANVKGVKTEVYHHGWPKDPAWLEDADAILLYSDGSDRDEKAHPLLVGERMATIDRLMKRGVGFLAIHYAVFIPSKQGGDRYLDWLGGYFDYENGPAANKWFSKIETKNYAVRPATPLHPIARGLKPFEVKEEYYFNMRFREPDARRVPILTFDPNDADAAAVVAWAVQRGDGGRGFGYTGGHFHKNWQNEHVRRMVLNALLWTAGVEVPPGGVESTLPIDEPALSADTAPAASVSELSYVKGPTREATEQATVAATRRKLATCKINSWQVLGPVNAAFAAEGETDLNAIYEGAGGKALKWVENSKFVDEQWLNIDAAIGWLYRTIEVKSDQEVTLFIGSKRPVTVRLNAQPLVAGLGPHVGTSPLHHITRGAFYGHPQGLKWDKTFSGDPNNTPIEELGKRRKPAAILFPYGTMGQSLAQPLVDTTGGRFGPFAGQMFIADQTKCCVMRAALERVDGEFQGACFPFRSGFQSGNNRMAFAPDGSLYVGQTDRGWGSVGGKSYGLQRLVWTGEMPLEIHAMKLTPEGFELTFTQPVDPAAANQPENYSLQHYHYLYRPTYGSPQMDVTPVKGLSAKLSADGKKVRLTLPELRTGKIYELHIQNLRAKDGSELLHPVAYYTLNRLTGDKTILSAKN